MKRTRRKHSPEFKAKVALATLEGRAIQRCRIWPSDLTFTRIRSRNGRRSLLEKAAEAFGGTQVREAAPTVDVKTLQAKIEQLMDIPVHGSPQFRTV